VASGAPSLLRDELAGNKADPRSWRQRTAEIGSMVESTASEARQRRTAGRVGSKDEVSWKNRGEHSTSELLGRLIWWWLVIVGSGRIGDCVYFAKLESSEGKV
jgi:hypothetical protein